MVRDDDDVMDAEEAVRSAHMLQAKQMITNNVITKRKEQLSRWETSEMNAASTLRRNAKVQFHDADIFLSACMSGDEDEVDELLGKGADINTSTVDGLTALHQSVIDSKPEMVAFLCDKGADVNAQDNEGWTPLHAAACCGNVTIIKYLCNKGADLTIINSDKELALDLAEDEACRVFLENDYKAKGIDPEACRNRELTTMLFDVQQWIRDGIFSDTPHPRTGATALHVAAAKGYTQLMELLIKAGANVNAHDSDGWTPLHAAAHWAERDSCKILIEHGASIQQQPENGQSVLAVADKEIIEYLEELEKSVEKRRVPSVPPASVLAEKNPKVISPITTPAHHLLSTEQKHALTVRDELSENETLHSTAKHPRLSEKSPSLEKSEDERMPSVPKESHNSSDYASEEKSVAEQDAVERSQSVSSSERMSADRSIEQSPELVDERMSQDRSSSNSDRLVQSVRASSVASSEQKTPSISSSTSEQNVTATVPLRTQQQPNMWINQRVPLTTSRSFSCSDDASSSQLESEGTASGSGVSDSASASASLSESVNGSSSPMPSCSESSASSEASCSGSLPSTASRVSSLQASAASSEACISPTLHVTVKPPAVPSPSNSPGTVHRSASTPNSLPWVRTNSSNAQPPAFSSFLARDRVSAFKPPVKSVKEAPQSPVKSPVRPTFKPQPLSAPMMRPWQGTASATNESEAERRNTARMQRQFRRSTQGVTKEQLEEASRIASEESAKKRIGLSAGPRIARLASEEKDDSPENEERSATGSITSSRPSTAPTATVRPSQERASVDRHLSTGSSDVRGTPCTSATLTLPSAPSPSNTPSAANLRRKSQGVTINRSNRRGTGPVMAEDIHAAVTLRCVAPTQAVPSQNALPTAGYTPSAGAPFQSGASSGFPLLRSTHSQSLDRHEKSHSAPPPNNTSAVVRGVPVAPSVAGRVQSRVAGFPSTTTPTNTATATSFPSQERSSQLSSSSSTSQMNYKSLYEQQKTENERLRRELEEMRKVQIENGSSSARRSTSSSSVTMSRTPSSAISKSSSVVSMDEQERRQYDRKIAELEYELKSVNQLRVENQRLKEENGALVRVISKMTI